MSCKHSITKTTNSRKNDGYVARRKECHSCGYRYTTIEVEILNPRDGNNLHEALCNQVASEHSVRIDKIRQIIGV